MQAAKSSDANMAEGRMWLGERISVSAYAQNPPRPTDEEGGTPEFALQTEGPYPFRSS